ncbi:hypothetical protein N9W79_00735 [bacterium]|nr:hypothetical protein [bacterium]
MNALKKLILLSALLTQSLPTSAAFAGNDTVFFSSEQSTYQRLEIKVEKMVAVPDYIPGARNLEFQPVNLLISGAFESGKRVRMTSSMFAYQVAGEGYYSIMIPAVYGDELYLFANLMDLKEGNPYTSVGTVDETGIVEISRGYKVETALVKYRPSVLDKIMSWIVSLGGRVTESDDWLEVKVIEKK